jgi:hypothetical protein
MINVTLAGSFHDGMALGTMTVAYVFCVLLTGLVIVGMICMISETWNYTFRHASKINRKVNVKQLSQHIYGKETMLQFDLDLTIEKCTPEPNDFEVCRIWMSSIFIGLGIGLCLYHLVVHPMSMALDYIVE